MPSFRLDPYLWVHLAGLAAVPIWLDICLLGIAAGNPLLPVTIEIALLILLGALPVVWMQWQRPFCIYSLVFLAVRPSCLNEQQRQTLGLFQGPIVRLLSLLVPIPLVFSLGKIYQIAPIAADLSPFPSRTWGFLAAAGAFFLANLFLQVPVSVAKVLLTSDRVHARLTPYPVEQIPKNFTLLGLPVKKILPTLIQIPPAEVPESEVSADNAPGISLKDLEEPDAADVASSGLREPEIEAGVGDDDLDMKDSTVPEGSSSALEGSDAQRLHLQVNEFNADAESALQGHRQGNSVDSGDEVPDSYYQSTENSSFQRDASSSEAVSTSAEGNHSDNQIQAPWEKVEDNESQELNGISESYRSEMDKP